MSEDVTCRAFSGGACFDWNEAEKSGTINAMKSKPAAFNLMHRKDKEFDFSGECHLPTRADWFRFLNITRCKCWLGAMWQQRVFVSGLCGGDLRGHVLPSIWSWKNTLPARKGTSLQADKYSRVAPSGLPDTLGSSRLAFFPHSTSSAGWNCINAHQDSQPDL